MQDLREIDACKRQDQRMNVISRYRKTTETVPFAFKMVNRVSDYQPWAKFTQDA